MQLFVTVKNAGKRRSLLDQASFVLPRAPGTLSDLLELFVRSQVQQFNTESVPPSLLELLTSDEMDSRVKIGKVSFQAMHKDDRQASEEDAVQTALLAFNDGLYKVFVDEMEVDSLDSPLSIGDGATVVFIKLTMLSGRLW